MLVPRDPKYAAIVLHRKPYNEGFPVCRSQVFTPQTNREFRGLLQTLISMETSLELMNERLAAR